MVPVHRAPWLISQRWSDLLFAHWPVEPERLAHALPAGVEPDVFGERAWIAIVAFRMLGSRPAAGPPRPTLPPIPELNVRTYVRVGGVPGVWFISLDASSPFFAAAGRALYGLPYRVARMTTVRHGDRRHYLSSRRTAAFAASYAPCGPVRRAENGSLEHFLVERYRLFSQRRGRLVTALVAHEPWPLQPAAVRIDVNEMAPPGLRFRGEPLVHFVESVDARISVPLSLPQLESGGWWPQPGSARPSSVRRSRRTVPLRA